MRILGWKLALVLGRLGKASRLAALTSPCRLRPMVVSLGLRLHSGNDGAYRIAADGEPPAARRGRRHGGTSHALECAVEGEVRFDRLSRALYSTDASVYQIVPLGVVLPRTRGRRPAPRCRLRPVPRAADGARRRHLAGGPVDRAGGRSSIARKYFNRVLEINAAERWARVQPGCVLDDLNRGAQAARACNSPPTSRPPTGPRSAAWSPTTRPARARSSTARRSTTSSRAEGRAGRRHRRSGSAALAGRAARMPSAASRTWKGRATGLLRRLAAGARRRRSTAVTRQILRRVGGYNLDAVRCSGRPDARRTFNLADLLRRLGGDARRDARGEAAAGRAAAGQGVLVVQFADLLDGPRGDADHPGAPAGRRRGDRPVRARQHEAQPRGVAAARLPRAATPAPSSSSSSTATGRRACPAAATGARSRTCDGAALGDHYHARPTPPRRPGSGSCASWPWACRWPRRATPRRSRSSRTRPSLRNACATTSPSSSTSSPGTAPGPASTPTPRSAACTSGRSSTSRPSDGVRRFEAIADEVADLVLKYGGALSGEHGDGLVRSPFQEKMYGPVLYQAFRELKRTFDPHGLLNPGKIVDAPPLTDEPAYGPRYVTPDVADDVRLLGRRRAAAGPPSCAPASASAARRAGGRCARRTRRRATSSTAPAAGPTRCGWR